jgi:hypothetical protein
MWCSTLGRTTAIQNFSGTNGSRISSISGAAFRAAGADYHMSDKAVRALRVQRPIAGGEGKLSRKNVSTVAFFL